MKFLFDIGGSKMRISATFDGENFSKPIINKTPKTAEEGVNVFSDTVKEIAGDGEIEGFWGGITGVWNKERDQLVYSPNMEGWVNKPIADFFSEKFSAPFKFENDADVVGLGEAHHGAGKGSNICVYITISTGVGGVRIVDGYIDKATVGFEPGHHVIDKSFIKENNSFYNSTFEGHVSGTALSKATGLDPIEIDDPDTWERLAFESAIGIYNTILFWSPDTVVIGGSMVVGDPAIPIDRIRYHVERMTEILPFTPENKKAELGAIGGIYGALTLTKQFPV